MFTETDQGSPGSPLHASTNVPGASEPDIEKRKAPEASADEEDAQSSRQKTALTTKRQRTSADVSFACPYSKRYPARHSRCYDYKLVRIRDIKQHLVRRHQRPIYCPRCKTVFSSEEARDSHIRVDSICTIKPEERSEGITEDQRRQLARKSSPLKSPEEQWYAIYDLLFPNCLHPASPYIDHNINRQLLSFTHFMEENGPRIIAQTLGENMIRFEPQEAITLFQERIMRSAIHDVFALWRDEHLDASTSHSSDSVAQPFSTRQMEGSKTPRPQHDIATDTVDVSESASLQQSLNMDGVLTEAHLIHPEQDALGTRNQPNTPSQLPSLILPNAESRNVTSNPQVPNEGTTELGTQLAPGAIGIGDISSVAQLLGHDATDEAA